MALIPEWEKRVGIWREELKKYFYTELGTYRLSGFLTRKHLPWREAARGRFRPMPPGKKWGKWWEYGWFRGSVTLPAEAAGKRIVAKPAQGGESLNLVNGRHAGRMFSGFDWENQFVPLTRSGRRGERFNILVEAYGGHGPQLCDGGPVPRGGFRMPPPGIPQQEVGRSTFGVWEEEVYRLWLDVEALWGVRSHLDDNSLRRAEIDAGLRDFTVLVDFEKPHGEFLDGVARARRKLAPLLAARNGATSPLVHAFGHAHLDVAWLWPLAETERKIARTFANQLALISEYPGYTFLQSEPHLYLMLKERHPDLYERVKRAVRAGRVIADGGMWVEADTNITGGESLIRQFVHGKRFFRREFGVDNEVLWLPDVFGYSAALPQILRGCGIKYFATSKIFWNYNGGDPFPLSTFNWEGIDGTDVLAHLFHDYNSTADSSRVIGNWENRPQKDGVSTILMSFGWGDGGGGPSRDHVEHLRRNADLEGVPRMKPSSPREFFRDIARREPPKERYVGELYFQAHRGTYTTQSRTKRGNRRGEFALREAEMWGAAARALRGRMPPAEKMEGLWRSLLLHQFHDIIPGSSIRRVYAEAEEAYGKIAAGAEAEAEKAAQELAGQGDGLTVFNSMSWERDALVALPRGWKAAAGPAGETLPAQKHGGRTWVEASVPACGWTTLRRAPKQGKAGGKVTASRNELDNGILRVRLNDRGEIVSLLDRGAGKEWVVRPSNRLLMFKDVPAGFDAWDIDRTYRSCPVALKEKAVVRAAASGPLFGAVGVRRKVGSSLLEQDIVLRRGSRVVEFRTKVDWRETHKLLKVAFTLDARSEDAIHEIQFGHLRRPAHRSRTYDADRFEVACQKWSAIAEEGRGFAVLNDCKYGASALGNTLELSLLRAPIHPDEKADQGRHEFTYALMVWNGPLVSSGVVRKAYELNRPPLAVSGSAGGEASLLSVDAPNVVIDTVKLAEDGSGDVVVRLYESMRTACRAIVSVALPVRTALETDMLERASRPLRPGRAGIPLDFRAFEVKTVRLKMRRGG